MLGINVDKVLRMLMAFTQPLPEPISWNSAHGAAIIARNPKLQCNYTSHPLVTF